MPSASALPVLANAIDEQLGVAGKAASDRGPDGIHDLRVATRRLRAALELWLAVSSSRKLDRSRRTIRKLGKLLGSLREADVNCSLLSALREGHPVNAIGIEFALAAETRRRKRRAKRLDKEMHRIDLGDLSKEIRSEIGSALDSNPEEGPIGSVARDELGRRLPRLSSLLDRALGHPGPRSLHRLRIELKKFRYSVELCEPAYDARRAPHLVRRLKSLQDALGLVQDANALHLRLAMLRSELRRDALPAIERSLLPPMRAIASLSRERTAAAIRELESARRQSFLSKFEAGLRT